MRSSVQRALRRAHPAARRESLESGETAAYITFHRKTQRNSQEPEMNTSIARKTVSLSLAALVTLTTLAGIATQADSQYAQSLNAASAAQLLAATAPRPANS